MSALSHLVLAMPVRSRLTDANAVAKNAGFLLAAQELLLLLALQRCQKWYLGSRHW